MTPNELNRRAFNRLTGAALGGMLTGVTLGCNKPDAAKKADATEGEKAAAAEPVVDVTTAEMHVCRGLNNCKGKGQGGENDCAGKGTCALAEHHGCHGDNKCKGQGGCGAMPGLNACKGKGACAVPLGDSAWKKARTHFEEAMTKAGKSFGDAPPKKA